MARSALERAWVVDSAGSIYEAVNESGQRLRSGQLDLKKLITQLLFTEHHPFVFVYMQGRRDSSGHLRDAQGHHLSPMRAEQRERMFTGEIMSKPDIVLVRGESVDGVYKRVLEHHPYVMSSTPMNAIEAPPLPSEAKLLPSEGVGYGVELTVDPFTASRRNARPETFEFADAHAAFAAMGAFSTYARMTLPESPTVVTLYQIPYHTPAAWRLARTPPDVLPGRLIRVAMAVRPDARDKTITQDLFHHWQKQRSAGLLQGRSRRRP